MANSSLNACLSAELHSANVFKLISISLKSAHR